jgi:hypothetical protein
MIKETRCLCPARSEVHTLREMSAILVVVIGLVIGLLLGSVRTAAADTVLRFAPEDTTVVAGDSAALRLWIDDEIAFRSVLIWVDFDPTIIASLDGQPGQLFVDTGVYIWEYFENILPGQWYGEAVVMDPEVSVTGPGEVFVWHFEGIVEGVSPVTCAEIRLFDPDGIYIEDVSVAPTTVIIADPSPVPDIGAVGPYLTLAPNPFNPRTLVTFSLDRAGTGRIDVFDPRGRWFGTLWEGWCPDTALTFTWDGTDNSGLQSAGGVYFYRITTNNGQHKGKIIKQGQR